MLQRLIILCAFTCLVALAWAAEKQPAPEPIVPPTAADKALAAKALTVAAKVQGTAGQEQANFLVNDWPRGFVRTLAGEQKASAKQLAGARGEVTRMLNVMELAPSWPKPVTTYVPYAVKKPSIDGKLDDVVWATAVTYEGAYPMNCAVRVTKPNTYWRLLWDEQYLYAAFECEDSDVIAPEVKRNGPVYNYDCVEIFLLPDLAKRAYWEIEVSPAGSLYEGLNVKHPTHWGADIDLTAEVKGMKVAYSIDAASKTKGYVIELAIPWNQLPGAAADKTGHAGDTLWFTLARMDKNKDDFTAYDFTPTLSWTHNIWNYGQMVLMR